MVWRGIRARRLLSLTMLVLVALVVSGSVVGVSFSGLTDVSRGSAAALVLLGLVALTGQAMESVRRREAELALARLRGTRGLRLLVFAAAEPCVVVAAGSVVGVVAGWLVLSWVVHAWLPVGTEVTLGIEEWGAAALVSVVSMLLVVATSGRVTRAPLLEQLAGARRPRVATTVSLFLQLVLVLGAVVSLYQAHQTVRSRVDWVTLVSPAVVGLAAGQLLTWLVLALLAVVVPHSSRAPMGWFLAVRRLLRRADSLAVVRLVVAAGVVFAVAASASTAAHDWREQRAALQVGGSLSYPVPTGALAAYAAAHLADPDGRWLMATASYSDSTEPRERRVFVDTARWGQVEGDFFAGTPAAAVTDVLAGFPAPPASVYQRGGSASATVTAASLRTADRVRLSFQYVDDSGDLTVRDLPFRPGHAVAAPDGRRRFTVALPDCRRSCVLSELDIAGATISPLRLLDVGFAGSDPLARSSGVQLRQTPFQIRSTRVGGGLSIELHGGPRRFGGVAGGLLATFGHGAAQPAVSTPGVVYDRVHAHPSVVGVDGASRPISVTATAPALPLVGTTGSLLDLGSFLVGARGSTPGTVAVVLARADTPAGVLAALRGTGVVQPPTAYASTVTRLGAEPRAQGTRLYLLVAVFAGLIALVSIASSVAQQTRERRREAASLRSVGVHARTVAGAYRAEALLLATTTLVGTAIAAWATSRTLLPALPLVSGWAFAPALDAAPQSWFVALSGVAAGAVVGVFTYLSSRGVGRTSPPRILREDVS